MPSAELKGIVQTLCFVTQTKINLGYQSISQRGTLRVVIAVLVCLDTFVYLVRFFSLGLFSQLMYQCKLDSFFGENDSIFHSSLKAFHAATEGILKYICISIFSFSSIGALEMQMLPCWSARLSIDTPHDTVSYTHLTLPTTPYV